jgi:hypothetical protein
LLDKGGWWGHCQWHIVHCMYYRGQNTLVVTF